MENYNNGISPFIRAMLYPTEDGGVGAPDNIIQTTSAAYQQYVTLRNSHIERIAVYSAIEGQIAGNPPYNQDELEANGLGHAANFNNFKARSLFDRTAQAYWNLINSTEYFTKIVLAGNAPKTQEYADIIARNFSDVVKEWEDFQPNFNLLGSQLTKFGLCPIIFPHEESPIWEVIDVSKFFIPAQTQVFLTKLSNFCVESVYTVQDLYQIYKDKNADNWNKEAIASFLLLRANTLTQNQVSPGWNLMDLQRWIDNNDAQVNQFFTDTVRLINMYQKEYSDGKISHYIFSADLFNTVTTASSSTLTKDFLYFQDRQYNSIEEALLVFTASPGEWTIHGNVGVGAKMFAIAQAINMNDCTTVDMARMSSTPLIQSQSTGGKEAAAIRIYPGVFTDIGSNTFVPNPMGANLNQVIGASQYLSQGLDVNIANGGDDPGYPDRSQGSVSDGQAKRQSFKEFGVLKNMVSHFYDTFDKVIRTTFIRFLTMKANAPGYELAKEFKRRCIEEGVPEVLFDTAKKGLHGLPVQFKSVRASRVAGDGSTLARIMGLESLGPIMGTFNQQELAAYKREWVAATLGVDYVNTFASSDGQGDELSGGASLAKQEDNWMSAGKEATFSADNDQAAHADEHMGTLSQVVQAVAQQQLSPVDANQIMELGIPHLTQHIQFMSKAPQFYRDTLNRLEKPYKQLVQWAQLNKRNAEAMIEAAKKKQMQDQAQTQAVMSDAQRKDFVAQTDNARKDADLAAKNERSDKANEVRGEQMKAKTDADIENQRRLTEAKANATAKGKEQQDLLSKTPAELDNQLQGLLGNTPSTVDFEGA